MWAEMLEPGSEVDTELFDRLAAATSDVNLPAVRGLMADERLRVGDEVRNVLRERPERIHR